MRALLGLTVGAFILSPPAVAGEGEVYPSDVRTITATEATSECLNDPKTPVCAVETFLACIARVDHDLCKQVTKLSITATKKTDIFAYRIESSCFFKRDETTATKQLTGPSDLYADVAIRIYVDGSDFSNSDVYYHTVALTPRGWEVLSHEIEGEVGPVEFDCTPEPSSYR